MSPSSRGIAIAIAIVVATACGGSSDSSSGTGSSSGTSGSADTASCDALQDDARDVVSRAIDANRTCATVADCVEVSFATSCFDSCSRGVAKTGTSAVDAAKADAEKNTCQSFKAKGCKSISPPCEPPSLRCENGKCES